MSKQPALLAQVASSASGKIKRSAGPLTPPPETPSPKTLPYPTTTMQNFWPSTATDTPYTHAHTQTRYTPHYGRPYLPRYPRSQASITACATHWSVTQPANTSCRTPMARRTGGGMEHENKKLCGMHSGQGWKQGGEYEGRRRWGWCEAWCGVR